MMITRWAPLALWLGSALGLIAVSLAMNWRLPW